MGSKRAGFNLNQHAFKSAKRIILDENYCRKYKNNLSV
jgi:hypothetical protein